MDQILQQMPTFDEASMFPFYESPMTTKEEIKTYLTTWLRKGHRPEVTYSKNGEVFELIASFRRAGWSHGVFINQTYDRYLFLIEEFDTFIELAESNTFTGLIDDVTEFYHNRWNEKKGGHVPKLKMDLF